jgi:predicted ABC-class ATPase
MGLVAFVANHSVLPRTSGALDTPMELCTSPPSLENSSYTSDEGGLAGALAFSSPPSLQVEVVLPNRGVVSGMGVRRGVTLIVGGGFHGKSTLLKAIEAGVYNHIPGE